MPELTYVGLGGLTYKEAPNGDLLVFGTATDPTLDLDQQVCDPQWLKEAMPEWFATGANVREQHQNIAAGVGLELSQDGAKWQLKSEVVDPGTKDKVKKGVLKGYSIGIKGAQVDRSDAALQVAPGGVIKGGKIVEVSLVDRPANPSATITIAKSVDGEWELTKADENSAYESKADGVPCPKCYGMGFTVGDGAEHEECDQCHGSGTVEVTTRPSEAYTTPQEQPLDPKAGKRDCPTCDGMGHVAARDDGGRFNGKAMRCPDCDGKGSALEDKGLAAEPDPDCETCHGTGKIRDGHVDCPDCVQGKAVWSTKTQNDLPDSSFAYIEPGGKKDADGKTVPRSKRHFPLYDADGKPDAAHIRNALARASQSPFGKKAMPKILAAAKKAGVEVSDDEKSAHPTAILIETLNKAADGGYKHDPATLAQVRDGIAECLIAEVEEFGEGDDERYDVQQLTDVLNTFLSWWQDEAMSGETADPFSKEPTLMSMISLGVSADLIKAASAEDATEDTKAELRSEMLKALGLDKEAIERSQKESAEEIASLKSELAEVKKMAAPTNFVKRATEIQQRRASEADQLEAEADRLKAAGMAHPDPETRAGYLKLAEERFSEARSLRQTGLGD